MIPRAGVPPALLLLWFQESREVPTFILKAGSEKSDTDVEWDWDYYSEKLSFDSEVQVESAYGIWKIVINDSEKHREM